MSHLGRLRSSTLSDAAARTAYRLGFPLARLWWKLLRSRHEGVLVVVYVGHAILLLRTSYRRQWTLPGGGIQRGETPETAAQRELAEETGLIVRELVPVGSIRGIWDGLRDHVYFFEVRLERLPQLQFDNREIIGARLASAADLLDLPLIPPVAAYLSTISPERQT